jgi:hypothetical protein
MSGSGKGILAFMSVGAAVVIYAVHYQQTWEKTEMRKGVLRDIERQRQKGEGRSAAAAAANASSSHDSGKIS